MHYFPSVNLITRPEKFIVEPLPELLNTCNQSFLGKQYPKSERVSGIRTDPQLQLLVRCVPRPNLASLTMK